jgi:hypothetical protein
MSQGGGFMFTGFELNIQGSNSEFIETGKKVFTQNKNLVEQDLIKFLDSGGSIDGTRLQNSWFPQVKSDVFLSHSHNDYETALTIAGWLHQVFKLDVFIDSCVWGSADKLLRRIDNKYCKIEEGGSYSYEKRNYSTSHVHMMLSTALTSMIDNSECLLFLNTPNSINTKEVIKQKTNSPWIYFEIMMSHLVEKKEPSRELIKKAMFEATGKQLTIEYEIYTRHLTTLEFNDLENWKNTFQHSANLYHPLDVLYKQKGLIKEFSILQG